jgi:hypothetical protein
MKMVLLIIVYLQLLDDIPIINDYEIFKASCFT